MRHGAEEIWSEAANPRNFIVRVGQVEFLDVRVRFRRRLIERLND
jgi:hypothetical protein